MKRREVRAEPRAISTYFFDQILFEAERAVQRAVLLGEVPHEADEMEPQSPRFLYAASAGPISVTECRAVADEAVSSATSGEELCSSWAVGPVTRNRHIDSRLWRDYTPEPYREELIQFVSLEHGRTRVLAQELKEMWDQVEALMARNAARRAVIQSDYHKKLEDLKKTVFWRAEDVLQRYELDLTLPTQLLRTKGGHVPSLPPMEVSAAAESSRTSSSSMFQQMTPNAHIKLRFDMSAASNGVEAAPRERGSSSHVSTGATPNTSDVPVVCSTPRRREKTEVSTPAKAIPEKKAKAYTKTKEELLDPTQRSHCLRRLFAPLLQRREELPKNLTILLAEIQKCQCEVLPQLEEALANCSMFQIPLHVPFQMIFRYISRYLTRELPTVPLEEKLKDNSMAEMREEVAALRAFILEKGHDEARLDNLSSRDRQDLAQAMWHQLLAELQRHHSLHEKFLQHYSEMTGCHATEMKKLKEALDDCDRSSSMALQQLVDDAKESIAVIQSMTEKIKDVVKEVEGAYEKDSETLKKSLAEKEYKIERSEKQQERLARRVREAVKEYFTEQMRYEELSQEVLQERLALAQVHTSYEQVKHAVKTCYDEAIASDARAMKIQKMLKKSEKVRSFLVTSCRQHVGRLETDDYFRRRRIADNGATNMKEWSRCLSDIVAVYEDRFEGISAKGKVSWQMDYLVAGERDWAVANFLEGREELTKLDRRMAEIQKVFQELDDELPCLIPPESDDIIALRAAMRNIDGPLNVQRQLPHLHDVSTSATKDRIMALMNATSTSPLDAPAGGEPNAAGRDGRVLNLDRRVKERIPREPYVADHNDEISAQTQSTRPSPLGGGNRGCAAAPKQRKSRMEEPVLLPPLEADDPPLTAGLD